MNFALLLSLAGGIAFQRANPFRRANANPLPFLESVKPPNLQARRPALETPAEAERRRGPARRHERITRVVLTLMVAVLAATATLCAQGAYRITRVRQEAKLSNELRQREAELRAVTQTCRYLQSLVARQAAEESWSEEVHLMAVKHPARRAVHRTPHVIKL